MYITHEGKRTSISNLRLLDKVKITNDIKHSVIHSNINNMELLVSYKTPVAYALDGLWHYTSRKYSPTTSKQITRFLNARVGGRTNALEVNQQEIDEIADLWGI